MFRYRSIQKWLFKGQSSHYNNTCTGTCMWLPQPKRKLYQWDIGAWTLTLKLAQIIYNNIRSTSIATCSREMGQMEWEIQNARLPSIFKRLYRAHKLIKLLTKQRTYILFSHWRQICTRNLHVWGNVVSSQCVSPSGVRQHFCTDNSRQVYHDVMTLPRGWRYHRVKTMLCTTISVMILAGDENIWNRSGVEGAALRPPRRVQGQSPCWGYGDKAPFR